MEKPGRPAQLKAHRGRDTLYKEWWGWKSADVEYIQLVDVEGDMVQDQANSARITGDEDSLEKKGLSGRRLTHLDSCTWAPSRSAPSRPATGVEHREYLPKDAPSATTHRRGGRSQQISFRSNGRISVLVPAVVGFRTAIDAAASHTTTLAITDDDGTAADNRGHFFLGQSAN